MRKLFALLAALVLLTAAVCAAGESGPDLYDLYTVAETGEVWAGIAVPIMEGVAAGSPASVPENSRNLAVWDGSVFRPVSMGLVTGNGKLLVLLYDTDGEKPAIPEYPFIAAGTVLEVQDLLVRTGDRMKSRINREVYDAAALSWQGMDCLLLTLSGDAEPGSPLLTKDGKLAGIIAAEYAEGDYRYVALTVDTIYGCIQEAAALLEGTEEEISAGPEGYTVTIDAGLVTFDWSGMQLPEVPEGKKLYHIVADADNSYLNYTEVTEGLTSLSMILTPGRTYVSGLEAFAGAPDNVPQNYEVTQMPEAEPLTDHQFESREFDIADLTAKGEGDMPAPVSEVTEALLRSGNACINSVSAYDYTGSYEEATMLISLTAPDGSDYRYESVWYYDGSIRENDAWYVSFTDSGLLEMLNENGYPEGGYVLTLYIGGKLADSYTFTLIK